MTPRHLPPLWLWILWLLAAGGIAWLWLGDPGDSGFRNAGSIMAALLALGAGFLWFVLGSAHRGGLRATVGVGVILALGVGATLFRIEGFSGSMIPAFVPRFQEPLAVPPKGGSAAVVNLARTTPDDFPGFLGVERDGAVRDVRLARDWDSQPPELLWQQHVGAAWSAFAIVNGVAVTMEQRGGGEAVSAYDLATGELLWLWTGSGHFTNFLGGDGPRATPTIDAGRVYALGAFGRLVCLDGATGTLVWERDLLTDYGVTPEMEQKNVLYGRSNSPLVFGKVVVVPAGGDESTRRAGLAAFDKQTGELVWESPPRQISFSSPRLAQLAGLEQVLIVNEDTVSGHSPDDGTLLWEHPWPGITSQSASVSQAVPVPPARVLVSKGYGGGSMLLELAPKPDGTFDAQPVWRAPRSLRTKFTNVVIEGGHVYGLSDGILECVELETGRRAWRDGRYGHGQILLVGDLLLVLSEEGELVLVDPTPDQPNRVLARRQVLEGKTWNHLALFGDLLAVRNGNEAAVYRLPRARE